MDFGISTGIDPQLISLVWALFYTFFYLLNCKTDVQEKGFYKNLITINKKAWNESKATYLKDRS